MRLIQATRRLLELANNGRLVFTLSDLRAIFSEDKPHNLKATIGRLVKEGVLARAHRGVYISRLTPHNADSLEEIAAAIRYGHYNYVSLESALSEYGRISQIPYSLTVMTTGRKGWYSTPIGSIHYTHTSRPPAEIHAGTVDVGRPLRLAREATALRDLRRVGRNMELVAQMDSAKRGQAYAG